ncbi:MULTISPECIES: alkaline phosphatase [Asticcacaulis]|uniref:alkaline phosphatase D family protein n=1 Tax=Asticcacaulis TaxID=76890 RepID=UPI001AE4BA57|nr:MULTISPECIES: alkaline phosphatase D family protein [Asticcacaulis]MBP2159681.1 alkaline phosphatase D [Asticcacaulis solisilvae]MDR6800492.1 alkaline phosphatase D [Asticcacaulis sp. BE141]
MFTRRLFLTSASAALWLPAAARSAARYPFTLGVASGSPRDDGMVLWTRLAPDPLNGGGMPKGTTEVRWRLCSDAAMSQEVRQGVFTTSDAVGHSVHLVLKGLKPGREYWYQFHYADADSPVGRTRTTSRADASIKLAHASCQSYEGGYFTAYKDMAEWTPDCVIHVGDYIYEGGIGTLGTRMRDIGRGRRQAFETVRLHNSAEIVTLWDYRNRYALYKSDTNLQAAHAAAPWIVAMDDHEVDNNWAAGIPQDPHAQTELEFRVRKLAAFQAYWEHMPIEKPPVLNGIDSTLQLYGRYRFGPAEINLLDTRQYRDDQACGDNRKQPCGVLTDPDRTLTGRAQEQWLLDGIARSDAAFTVLASQTWFSSFRYNPAPEAPERNLDQWDGYPAQRQKLTDALQRGKGHPVVVSGDWHCSAATTLHSDPYDAKTKRIGHEFAGTSIASGCPWARDMTDALSENPHVRYYNGDKRGYVRHVVTAGDWTAQFRTVTDPGVENSPVTTDTEVHTKDI